MMEFRWIPGRVCRVGVAPWREAHRESKGPSRASHQTCQGVWGLSKVPWVHMGSAFREELLVGSDSPQLPADTLAVLLCSVSTTFIPHKASIWSKGIKKMFSSFLACITGWFNIMSPSKTKFSCPLIIFMKELLVATKIKENCKGWHDRCELYDSRNPSHGNDTHFPLSKRLLQLYRLFLGFT